MNEPADGRLRGALAAGALLGLLGVAAAAFGAHGLARRVEPGALEVWRTAAHVQQLHAVALVAVGLFGERGPPSRLSRALRVAAVAWVAGVIAFSGSLYAIVLGAPRGLGTITPLGGVALLGGWLALAGGALRRARGDA